MTSYLRLTDLCHKSWDGVHEIAGSTDIDLILTATTYHS